MIDYCTLGAETFARQKNREILRQKLSRMTNLVTFFIFVFDFPKTSLQILP